MNPTIERSRKAWSEGKLWRAKEILQGRVASQPFDPRIMEEYGSVLLEMGDDLEAGRYLFLSGARAPEYEAPIALYLSRFASSTAIHLHASFPAEARKVRIEELPASVAEELRARGFKASDINKYIREPRAPDNSVGNVFAKYGCLLVAAVILVLFGAGVYAGIRQFVQWLS